MAIFRCVTHGEFENPKASNRSFCPQCGRNSRRVFGKSPTAPSNNSPTSSEPITEPTGGGNNISKTNGEIPKGTGETNTPTESEPPEIKVTRKVRVKIAKKKPEEVKAPVVKKKKVTGVQKPQIKVRVKTNRDKKLNKQEKTSSQWSKVKKVSGWPF
jgi:hypothetical protein